MENNRRLMSYSKYNFKKLMFVQLISVLRKNQVIDNNNI